MNSSIQGYEKRPLGVMVSQNNKGSRRGDPQMKSGFGAGTYLQLVLHPWLAGMVVNRVEELGRLEHVRFVVLNQRSNVRKVLLATSPPPTTSVLAKGARLGRLVSETTTFLEY